ncbi:uncharacterized protein LOC143912141 [Arctopsyche grandis]|uniref:uncharacterized protein LOC143912141 n=1 Tax=Arctopsyche grandis TaxID=121162 RepID=UPI00406D8C46
MDSSIRRTVLLWFMATVAITFNGKWACESKSFVVAVKTSEFTCKEAYATNCSAPFEKLDNGSYIWSFYSDIKTPINNDVMVQFQSYELKNDQFKKSIFHFEKSICTFIESDMWIIKMIRKFSNIPDKCPIQTGPLNIVNFIAKETSFPPGIPLTTWKFLFIFKLKDEEQARLDVVFKVEKK